MKNTLRPLARCGVPNSEDWQKAVATEVRAHLAELGANGWTLYDIAVELGTGRTSLYTWRVGSADMPASKLLALRALVAANVKKAIGQ